MMKRIASLLLCVCMLVSLTACAGNGATADLDDSVSGVETSSVETSTPEQDTESLPEEGTEPEEPAGEDASGLDPNAPIEYAPTVLVDTEQYSITAENIVNDPEQGWIIDLSFENKTSNKLNFNAIAGAVNGVEFSSWPYLNCAVEAGETGMSTVYLGEDCFNFIPEEILAVFTDIELTIEVGELSEVKGGEEYFSPIAQERVHMYPYGEENAAPYVYEPQSTDKVLMDNEYVTVTLVDCRQEDEFPIMGYMVRFLVENKSDMDIRISESDATINGQQMNSYFSDTIQAGNRRFSFAVWSNSSYDIPEVEEIVLTLQVLDLDANVLVDKTPLTIQP